LFHLHVVLNQCAFVYFSTAHERTLKNLNKAYTVFPWAKKWAKIKMAKH